MADEKHEAPKVEAKKEEKKPEHCIAVRGNQTCPKCGWHVGSKEPHAVA